MRWFVLIFTYLAITLIFSHQIFAGTFQLTTIGSLPTNGATFSQWWYTSSQPHFTGTALASTTITTDIDGNQSTVTADSDGNWFFTPAALSEGNHSVSFTSNGSTISFTLTIGENVPEGVSAPTAPETPVAGFITPTLTLISLGGAFVVGGLRLKKRSC